MSRNAGPWVGWWILTTTLTLVVVAFAVRRLLVDVPHLLSGTVPDQGPDVQYARHPAVGYLHIVPALVYLVLAPMQLWAPFRTGHYRVHKLVGRGLVAAALVAGVFAVTFGLLYPFGGPVEGAAAAVFGGWFVVSLGLAWRAIRSGDVTAHRRWMIRAFVVGLGVGTIRVWIGAWTALGALDLRDDFALSFWLGLTLHAGVAEWWLRRRPLPPEAAPAR